MAGRGAGSRGGPLEPPATAEIRLYSRWTEVAWRGLNGAPIPAALGGILAPAAVVYQWLGEAQSWSSFFPAAPPALNAFDTFQTDASYWIAVAEAVDWTVAGGGGVP